MNFFGHAVTAATHDDSPRFVLGAMLPDLAAMARVRLPEPVDAQVRSGVRFHHVTDSAFHRNPAFTTACGAALGELGAAGVARGPARAVAHVGFELLLDGAISGDTRGLTAYRAALEVGAEGVGGSDAPEPWDTLGAMLRRLSAAPVPRAYDDPAFVAARLHDILGRRPRLSLGPDDFAPVSAWCERARGPIREQAAALSAEVAEASILAFTAP